VSSDGRGDDAIGSAVHVVTRTVRVGDIDSLASAFESWPKPRELFETNARRVAEGTLDMVVASVESHWRGIC
jgi:hypothetical protein